MSNSHAHPPLKAVTLTHVRYQRGDQLGHFLAWISLVPVFISLGGFVSHFIFRRELQGMFFALGLLISQFINEIIKTSVQQARPETCALLETCDSHGWPSSHSQYTFFFAVYFTLLTYYKIGILARKQLWVVGLLVWPLAIFTMYSRVYLGYHTVAQVIAGAALGAVLGGGWFWVVNYLLRGYFPTIEESAFGSSSTKMLGPRENMFLTSAPVEKSLNRANLDFYCCFSRGQKNKRIKLYLAGPAALFSNISAQLPSFRRVERGPE
ncbi:lipid phosphate phosphatase gamma, chloroplastic [Olea europaea subsp. europaea]|uniref:Lipid phosphate phosphatase gamma, chloroplastic n=1 Tax=Olea europaea subsp. europaea TaxID=158383 RepID=A0A8S0SY38_OLEEU|nr:lipid phosphate phosphatase gamma, chloroplastic [Olea europaea subsp. europaea]